jgi:pyruvate/2-oxoacid:ferredoxin oxidoreductase alpha subunit
VAVLDRNISFGHGGIMASEIRSALASLPVPPPVFSFVGGLGGRDVTPATLEAVIHHALAHERPETETLWVDLKE